MDTDTLSTPFVVQELNNKISQLEESAQIRENILSKSLEKNRLQEAYIDTFMETLVEYLKGNDLDKEVAADLADCFGRELTRKVYGRIRIEGDVEFVIPLDLNLDNIAQELDIHIGEAYNSDVKVEYSDVSLVEVEEK
jgi:hypothetical protein